MKNKGMNIVNEENENKQVHKDLLLVMVINAVLLAGMIALYFINRTSGGVDRFFAEVIKF